MPCADMNAELRKKAKNKFEKDFFKLMINSVFRKTMENMRKHRVIKLVVTYRRRNQLVSEPNHYMSKQFSEYLGMLILGISKTLMYEFWFGYIRLKYGDRAKLCYTDTDSFIIHITTEDFYKDISNDVEKGFDTSNYDENDDIFQQVRTKK